MSRCIQQARRAAEVGQRGDLTQVRGIFWLAHATSFAKRDFIIHWVMTFNSQGVSPDRKGFYQPRARIHSPMPSDIAARAILRNTGLLMKG